MFQEYIILAGTSYCQENIKKFAGPGIGDYEMVGEPNNPHDKNAIKVALFGHFEFGYIPRSIAKELAPLMDNGGCFVAEYQFRNGSPNYDTIGLTVNIKEVN